MAKSSKKIVYGLEIRDDALLLAKLVYAQSTPKITQILKSELPPRIVIDGEVIDPEALRDAVFTLLSEASPKPSNLFVTINDMQFLKLAERFPDMPDEDIKEEIHHRVQSTDMTHDAEFQTGFLKQGNLSLTSTHHHPVLYVGLSKSRIDIVRSMIEQDGFPFSGFDLLPLSFFRTLSLTQTDSGFKLYLVAESQFIDLTITTNNQAIFTRSFRLNLSDIYEGSPKEALAVLTQKITLFLFTYSNTFPQEPIPTSVTFFSRLHFSDRLLDGLSAHFSDLSFDMFDPKTLSHAASTEDLLRDAVPAIGLALSYFEEPGQSIRLTKVKRHLGPIFDPKLLRQFAAIGVVIFAVLFGLSTGMNALSDRYQNQIKLTKEELRSLQSGDYLRRQKAIKAMEARIGFLERPLSRRQQASVFLETLVKGLPDSCTLRSLDVNRNRQVVVKGSSFSQQGIYEFHRYLQQTFRDVVINGVSVDQSGQQQLFEIVFVRT